MITCRRLGVVRVCSERDYNLKYKDKGYKIVEQEQLNEPVKDEKQALQEELDNLGVEYDKRWGIEKLKEVKERA